MAANTDRPVDRPRVDQRIFMHPENLAAMIFLAQMMLVSMILRMQIAAHLAQHREH